MKFDGRDGYTLSTRKWFYSNHGLVSVNDEGDISEGYDGSVCHGNSDKFTPEEKAEIADYMIAKWTAFKENLGGIDE